MPAPLSSLMWWAPDDSGTALRIPLYGGATRVPLGFADPVGQEPAAAVKGAPVADAGQVHKHSVVVCDVSMCADRLLVAAA